MSVRSSPRNSIASEILGAGPLSQGTRGYLSARAKNTFHDYVISKWREAEKAGLTKAQLARRIGKSPEQVTRLLGAPGNWTIETVALLLAGIAKEELLPHSASFEKRVSSNRHASDLLVESQWKDQRNRSGSQSSIMPLTWDRAA